MTDASNEAHLRPFFPSAPDFAAASAAHFAFLVDEFDMSGPTVIDRAGEAYELRFDGPRTTVLLSWEVVGGYLTCQLIPRLADGALDGDVRKWRSPIEILASRGAMSESFLQDDLDDVDEAGYGRALDRLADNLRRHCAAILGGEWLVERRSRT